MPYFLPLIILLCDITPASARFAPHGQVMCGIMCLCRLCLSLLKVRQPVPTHFVFFYACSSDSPIAVLLCKRLLEATSVIRSTSGIIYHRASSLYEDVGEALGSPTC